MKMGDMKINIGLNEETLKLLAELRNYTWKKYDDTTHAWPSNFLSAAYTANDYKNTTDYQIIKDILEKETKSMKYMNFGSESVSAMINVPHMPLKLKLTNITVAAMDKLRTIGDCSVHFGPDGITLTLEANTYHQFDADGMVFSTAGPTFDPSFSILSLVQHEFILRPYKFVKGEGREVDKHIGRRDKEFVQFPLYAVESQVRQDRHYLTPGGKTLVLDNDGYLYMQEKPLKEGDAVTVEIQGEFIAGTYNGESDDMYAIIDLDGDGDEWIRVQAHRVHRA